MNDSTCPICGHNHLDYDDEDCVSCGCTAERVDGGMQCAHCYEPLRYATELPGHVGAVCYPPADA